MSKGFTPTLRIASNTAPKDFTHEQFRRFKNILDQFKEKEIPFRCDNCNTAATINFPDILFHSHGWCWTWFIWFGSE